MQWNPRAGMVERCAAWSWGSILEGLGWDHWTQNYTRMRECCLALMLTPHHGGLGGHGPHIEVFHRLGDVELVHGGDDDGRGGEEEEQDEEDHIDNQAAQPPDEASDGQVLPGKVRGGGSL